MSVAPLLKAVKQSGGTLYVFPSANQDIAKTFSDDDARFVFDKYALLNLPNVKTPINNSNDIVFENIGSVSTGISSIPVPPGIYTDTNITFAAALQNYAMNMESIILNGQNNFGQAYDNSTYQTVSEKVFWKFLKEINILNFENTADQSNINDRYVESTNSTYEKVVQAIGDISLINNVNEKGVSYTEIYMHIPTNSGGTPDILFKSEEDLNYKAGFEWIGDDEFLKGRTNNTIHPTGIDINAWYDDDSNNTYKSASTFNDVTNTNRTVQLIGGSPKDVSISNLDGIMLDFDLSNYTKATDNSINTFDEFNTISESSNKYKFNCVLIYYTVYNTTNPNNSVRNLYGILVLDNFQEGGDGAFINRYEKEKPNQILGTSGNSFSFKLNIRFDSYVENVSAETIINDYNTFSLDLFTDLMLKLQNVNDKFNRTLAYNEELLVQIEALKDLLLINPSNVDILNELEILKSYINNNIEAANTNQFTLDLINNTNQRLNNLINGSINIDIGVNTDFLESGNGILLDRSITNKVKIINTQQKYNFSVCRNDSGSLNVLTNNGLNVNSNINNNIITMGKYTTMYREPNLLDIYDNVILNLEDPINGWFVGQTFKLVLERGFTLNGNYNLLIRVDSSNRLNSNTSYSKTALVIPLTNLVENTKHIIEILCVNSTQLNFVYDVLT